MIHAASRPRRGEASPGGWTCLKPEGATLSEHDVRYLADRGVDLQTAQAADYWSATRPSEVPDVYSAYFRRQTPALIAPHYSPDGRTVSFQMHPLRPRADSRGRIQKWVSPKAEAAPVILSCHPWTADEVRNGDGPLWACEGLTRGHALAPLSIPAVTYPGCWSWQQGGKPLECWQHTNLAGRLVYLVPDADHTIKENVQKALAAQVAYLESEGATVLLVRVPEVNGDPDAGLDDYIAAADDPAAAVEALKRDARPFVPADAGRERLKKDERLRLAVAEVRRGLEALETRTRGECSAYALAHYLVGEAERHGKTAERGLLVRQSRRQIASGVRVALATVSKTLKRLKEVEFLEPVAGSRAQHEAASYLLLYPSGGGSEFSEHIEGQGAAGEEETETGKEGESSLSTRESFLSVHLTRGAMKSVNGREKLPALRNSKLVHEYARKDGRRVVVDSRYYPRYGKKCEAIIRYVLEAGKVHERELHEEFGSPTSRIRDFRRTWLEKKMLRDGVLVRDGAWILPAPDWPEALERVRERTGEEEDNRRQDERYAEQGRTFRARLAGERRGTVAKPETVPELAGPERTAEIVARALEREDVAIIEEQRRKVGETAEVFIHDRLHELGSIRMEMLREVWADRGGNPSHIWRTAKRMGCRFRKLPEYDNALFVYPPAAGPPSGHVESSLRREHLRLLENVEAEEPAPIPPNLTKPDTESPPEEGWRSHPLDCECADCAASMPTYVRPWSGA